MQERNGTEQEEHIKMADKEQNCRKGVYPILEVISDKWLQNLLEHI